jgi:hypothetical protein
MLSYQRNSLFIKKSTLFYTVRIPSCSNGFTDVPSYPEAVENEKERLREKGVDIRKQVRDARGVRPCKKLACPERQYEEVRAMKERSEKRNK